MKKHCSSLLLVLGLAFTSQAATYNTGDYTNPFNGHDGVIPDGDLSGWTDVRTVDVGLTGQYITGLRVSLDISGGYNGDLYGYLVHDTGFSVLLNRVGVGSGNAFGYGDPGFDITLHSSGFGDIHTASGGGSQITGDYTADGRAISPLSSPSAFDSASRDAGLAVFNNLNPNGTWTLFFADTSGLYQSTVNSWSLSIDYVPEPATVALGIFGALFGVVQGVRYFRRKSA